MFKVLFVNHLICYILFIGFVVPLQPAEQKFYTPDVTTYGKYPEYLEMQLTVL